MANTLPAVIFLITMDILSMMVAQDTPHVCSNDTYLTGVIGSLYTGNTVRHANLENLLSSLPTIINSSSGFYNASTGKFGNRVYATVLCRGDVQIEACQTCAQTAARGLLTLCPDNIQGVVWQDNCLLRYSDTEIVGTLVTNGFEPHWQKWKGGHVSNPKQFQDSLSSLLGHLKSKAVGSNISKVRVAAGNASGPGSQLIYALVQCTPDLDPNNCNTCLNNASNYLIPACPCYNRTGGAIFLANCFLQYDDHSFFDESKLESLAAEVPAPSPNGDHGIKKTRVIIPVAVSIPVSLALTIFVVEILLRRRRKYKQPELGEAIEDVKTVPRSENCSERIQQHETKCKQYCFSEIKEATKDFLPASMLGMGRFGTVFKGVLHDGKKIAVKKLSEDSRLGDMQFEDVVSSLVRVRHKNLVELFGYSMTEGKEKVLVYELVPKGSLNHYIFDAKEPLDWYVRYKIIQGIAAGLAYLHEGLSETIIQFDLKASDILLGESMNPKIGDFGLAKLFGHRETYIITVKNSAGNRGHMAPEYIAHANYSVKSDVFSFGVLLLEIIRGKRRNHMNEEGLVSYAFECWRNGRTEAIADPFLMSASAASPMSEVEK